MPVYMSIQEIFYRAQVNSIVSQLLMAIALIFLASELNFRFVEKPLRDYGSQLAARFEARTERDFSFGDHATKDGQA
jgi:hypothetical protein